MLRRAVPERISNRSSYVGVNVFDGHASAPLHHVVDLQQFAVGGACCLEEAYARAGGRAFDRISCFGHGAPSLSSDRHNATQSSTVHAEEPLFTGVRGKGRSREFACTRLHSTPFRYHRGKGTKGGIIVPDQPDYMRV